MHVLPTIIIRFRRILTPRNATSLMCILSVASLFLSYLFSLLPSSIHVVGWDKFLLLLLQWSTPSFHPLSLFFVCKLIFKIIFHTHSLKLLYFYQKEFENKKQKHFILRMKKFKILMIKIKFFFRRIIVI